MDDKYFPCDCAHCKYYKTWDMSVDDYVSYCHKLKLQLDDCDQIFCKVKCPLTQEEWEHRLQ